jgi:hypothetical protein
MNELAIASQRITDLQAAVADGNYSALQEMLLAQAVTLHHIGMGFLEKSNSFSRFSEKKICVDLALRALGQSQKTIATMKILQVKQ